MTSSKDFECLRRNDEHLIYLQLLRPGTDASPSALVDLIEALKINVQLKRVRMFVPRDFFRDDNIQSEEEDPRIRRLLFETAGSLPNLEELKFDSYTGLVSFPVDVLSRTLLLARHLKELELWDLKLAVNNLNHAMDFERLKSSLEGHPTLQKFTLYNCQLKQDISCTLDPLLHALATAPNLKQVYITAAAVASSASSAVTFSCSALEHLCQSTSLQELGLWKFNFLYSQEQESKDGEPLCLMAPAIAQSNAMKTFEFGRCKVSSAGDEALGQMLRVNTSLEELDINLYSSQECNLVATAKALETNTTLKRLKLWGLLSRKNQEALVHMIRNNYVLETCRLLDADRDVSALIDFFISLNRKGRQKLLLNEQTVGDWINYFVEDGGHLDSIYYYLSMKPGLCCLG